LPKGYTLYGELLGYTPTGQVIQKKYDYGCRQGEMKLEVYRVTHTTPDGLTTELSYPQIKEFCDKVELNASHLFFYGTPKQWMEDRGYTISSLERDWREPFIEQLEKE